MAYLKLRYRKWWAYHDIPPRLRPALGRRFGQNLETGDRKIAERRKDALWLHVWSKQIEEARTGAPFRIEEESTFYRKLLTKAGSGEEAALIRDRIAEEAQERTDRALQRAGYSDAREVPDDEEVPGLAEAERFFKLSTGLLTPTLEHVTEWLSTLDNEQKTKDMKKATVTRFAESFPHLQEIDRKSVQRWFNERVTKDNLTAKTLTRYLSELRSYWSYLRSLELVPEEVSPFDRLTMHGRKSSPWEAFSPDDVVRLLQAAERKGDRELAEVITLGMWTGARIESLCKLRVSDVRAGYINIEDDKTEAGTRKVPIHPKLAPTLKVFVDASQDGYVIAGLEGNKYGDRSDPVGKRFGHLKTALGFGKLFVFHSIRKTVTTMLENAGVPENVAADIVGHEKKTMTYGLYSKGNSLSVMQKAMGKIRYPGI